MLKRIISIIIILVMFTFISCKDEVLPKPAGFLRLDYPEAKYLNFENNCPFSFQMNETAIIKGEKECGFAITYPKMKAMGDKWVIKLT